MNIAIKKIACIVHAILKIRIEIELLILVSDFTIIDNCNCIIKIVCVWVEYTITFDCFPFFNLAVILDIISLSS